MNSMEWYCVVAAAKAYGEGRSDTDPTLTLSVLDQREVRHEVIEHLRRLEQNRIARLDAMRHVAGRSSNGELCDSDPHSFTLDSEKPIGDEWPPRSNSERPVA